MSGLPAWKRALLEKKKQQEQQEEIKKQKEQEAYIKSLPPWKRAIVMRDLEKAKSDGSPGGNAPTTPQSAGQDKWKAALSQANKLAASPGRSRVTWGSEQTKAASSTPSNKPPWARTPSPTTKAPSQIVGSPKATPNNKLSLMRTPSPTHPKPATITPSPSTTDTPSPREGRRGSVQSLADEFQKVSSPSSPPQSPTNTVKQRAKNVVTPAQAAKKATAQPAKQVVVQEQAASTPTATVQIDDSDLAGLPSWKRALIIKKRLKQAGLSELPVQKSDNKSTTAADEDKTDPSQPLSSKANPAPSALSAGKSRPNVVNRSDGESSGPNKLLQKEGVTLHAPIFNEVDQWANVAKDDPKFTQLPPWKQAMILRRRKDIAKRSGQETSPPDSPTVQHASENRKSSTSGGSQLENKKIGTKSPTKTSGKAEGKKTTTKAKTKAEEKKPATKTTNRSKTSAEEEKTTKKPVKSTSKTKSSSSGGRLGSTGSGSGSSSGLKPVRAAPTKPPSKETPPKEDKREAKKAEDKKAEDKGDEDKKEPMFTWNFSKHSVETGDAMSNSSDSELEDVQITSIDDELSDEDDSGIGGSGGTILTSYKPLGETENEKEKEKGALKSPLSTSTSDPEIMSSGMTRSESKSILVDTSKKSYKVSKVSCTFNIY